MRGVRKSFGATVALAGVDLAVAPGEVLAVVGENGAGKSTLMKVLAGVVRPDAGSMLLDGRPYAPRSPRDARSGGVAMIHQELALAPHLTVADNILLGAEPARGGLLDRAAVRQRARAALAELGRPDIDPSGIVGSLPIADRQVVEIARALAVGCRVLVLDEPTSSLTAADVRHLETLVRRLRDRGHAILFISHVLEEVRSFADRVTVLRDGATVGGGDLADVDDAAIVAWMVGRPLRDLYPRSPRTPGEVVLEIAELAGWRLPGSASLILRRGEVLGIAGLVGAGRTELLRAIFGLDPVRSGVLRVAGHAGPASPARRWAAGAGMVSEDRKAEGLAVGMSVADNLTLSRLGRLGPPGVVLPGRQAAAARRWIDSLQIRCSDVAQPVGALSGGNQQKVAVARLLHHDVDLLLLDEPTRGIDVGAKARIYAVIDELAARGRAVLLVSSHLPELLGVCDRVAVMCRGRLGPARPVDEVDERVLMQEAIGRA
ncbi:MAG: sugar ABC transporter ATP-binding protein [Planctomycetota bacterium]